MLDIQALGSLNQKRSVQGKQAEETGNINTGNDAYSKDK